MFALLASGEALLWIGSFFVGERPATSRPDASYQILSVGDSHTFGAGLPVEGSYPAQLQERLDAISPGEYSVINLGVPGMSTTQVRERLAVNVARYRPDLTILWCGVNNVWNRRIRHPSLVGWTAWLDSVGIHSRLYRLFRVMAHDRVLDGAEIVTRADGGRQEYERSERLGERTAVIVPTEDGTGKERVEGKMRETDWVLRHGGIVERIEHQHGPRRRGAEMRDRTAADLTSMVSWLERGGIPAILIRYPFHAGPFVWANEGISLAGEQSGAPVLDSSISLGRIPVAEVEWMPGRHPSAGTYAEVVTDLLPLIAEIREARR